MGVGRTPETQQRELVFPSPARTGPADRSQPRQQRGAAGSGTGTVGFKPLHTEMGWKKQVSSEPSCPLTSGRWSKIPAGLGWPIPINTAIASAALNISFSVVRGKPNSDLNHLWAWNGKKQTETANLCEGTVSLGFASSTNKAESKPTTEGRGRLAPGESHAGGCIAPVLQATPCADTPQPPASHREF